MKERNSWSLPWPNRSVGTWDKPLGRLLQASLCLSLAGSLWCYWPVFTWVDFWHQSYSICLQEDVIDLGGANLSPEANALGAQFLPILNQWVENVGSFCCRVNLGGDNILGLLFRDEFTVLSKFFCKSFQNMTWRYANNRTSWDLHISDVQQGVGYPGHAECNPTIPHAKW